MKRYINNSVGIGLLEIMISMILLAIGILGVLPLMMVSMDTVSDSRDLSLATQLAKERIEYYESLSSMPSDAFSDDEGSLDGRFSRISYITSHAADTLIPGDRYKVVVQVSWTGDDQTVQSTQLSTLMKKE